MRDIEILAPAGSPESLEAALRCGADAVYIGSKRFSARASAKNFDEEELFAAAKLCHLHNAKLYQAINTVISDSQLPELLDELRLAAQAGIDGFIVQDLGTAAIMREAVPEIPIHGSTQMTIHTPEGARLAKELGFTRIVAARELSGREIERLCKEDIEVEVFVHGAHCMSVSGQCYMSALIGSRSANRGGCAQACRLPFSAKGKPVGNDPECALSLKDMCLIPYLNELREMGVASLKIEGRMKRAEYVGAAVTACKTALDGGSPDLDTLRAVFSRSGFTDGYYKEKLSADMFGTRRKEDVTAAEAVLPQLRELYRKERKCSSVSFSLDVQKDKPCRLTASADGYSAEITGNIPQTAENRPISADFAEKQLSKLGGTVYDFGKLDFSADDGLAVSAAELNAMRRTAIERLDSLRSEGKKCGFHSVPLEFTGISQRRSPKKLRFMAYKAKEFLKLSAETLTAAEMLILPVREMEKLSPDEMAKLSESTVLCAAPPRFIADESKTAEALKRLKAAGIDHVHCSNLAHIRMAKSLEMTVHGGAELNIFNSAAAAELARLGAADITLSFELKLTQIERLRSPVPTGIYAYGRLPLMLCRSCPVKASSGGCKRCTGQLTDRTGRSFPAVCDGASTEILNSDILCLSDRLGDVKNVSFLTLRFTEESSTDISRITEAYLTGEKYHIPEKLGKPTNGLYYRGIL